MNPALGTHIGHWFIARTARTSRGAHVYRAPLFARTAPRPPPRYNVALPHTQREITAVNRVRSPQP
eukprot:612124-Prymnesium_polylepis.1